MQAPGLEILPHCCLRGITLGLALNFGLVACTDGKEDDPAGEGGKSDDGSEIAGDPILLEIGEPTSGFEVDVDQAAIDGDRLRLTLRHGGGCGEHDYRIFWDGVFLETFPMQASLVVVDETDDFCEALLVREVTFDLSPMREAAGSDSGEVVLGIANFSGDAPTLRWGGEPGGDLLPVEEGEPPRDSDGLVIEDARIDGDTLQVDVSHSGGCSEHEYRMFWDGLVLESFPPQVNLSLFHNSNGDFCEALLFESLTFDLSSLPVGGGPLIINLDGFQGELIAGDAE